VYGGGLAYHAYKSPQSIKEIVQAYHAAAPKLGFNMLLLDGHGKTVTIRLLPSWRQDKRTYDVLLISPALLRVTRTRVFIFASTVMTNMQFHIPPGTVEAIDALMAYQGVAVQSRTERDSLCQTPTVHEILIPGGIEHAQPTWAYFTAKLKGNSRWHETQSQAPRNGSWSMMLIDGLSHKEYIMRGMVGARGTIAGGKYVVFMEENPSAAQAH
ncbi:MAG: hypothetical protein ACYDAG_18945, partial [Chloroflexota bacterium]